MEKYIHFWAEHCRKYALFQKKFQIKVLRHRISNKKVREGICLSSPGVELGTSKDDTVEKSECIFSFLYNLIFKPYHLSNPLAPLQRRWTYALADFFVQNSMLKNFYLKLFWEYCVFSAVFSPKVNAIFHFCTI